MYLIDSKQRIPGFHPPESNVADATDVLNLTASTADIANQIATNIIDFDAVGDGLADDTVAIRDAFNSTDKYIFMPDGNYKVTDTINITAGGTAKHVKGNGNTVISVTLATAVRLLDLDTNISFENIIFDFNNSYCYQAMVYAESLGKISLKNVTIRNIKDIDSTTSSVLVIIPTHGNTLDIDGLNFINCLKRGNGNISDAGGNITGLYPSQQGTASGCNGVIRNVYVENMHCINASDVIILEDTSGIYISTAYSGDASNLLIENVRGVDFGKRLIKIDARNIDIKNVHGVNQYNDNLALIGTTSGVVTNGNITIDNCSAVGVFNIGLALVGDGFNVSNYYCNINRGGLSDAFGIIVGGKNIKIRDFDITSDRCIFLNNTVSLIENVSIKDGKLVTTSVAGAKPIHLPSTSFGFDNLVIENIVTTCNDPTNIARTFFLPDGLTGVANKTGTRLVIKNIKVKGVATNVIPITLSYITDAEIDNISAYSSAGSIYRIVSANNCNRILVNNLKAFNTCAVGVLLTSCDYSKIDNIDVNSMTNCVTLVTSTNTEIKNVPVAKCTVDSGSTATTTKLLPVAW